MIEFKTYDEQIEILRSRGMIIADPIQTKELLKQNNYYNLINAYKDIFVIPGISPDKYINGVSISELYALHQFDKKLRLSFSHFLIIIERTFSSIYAHEFSRSFPNQDDDYLNIDNYNTNAYFDEEQQRPILYSSRIIIALQEELYNAIEHNDPMICHYKNAYNRIPLWVFINKLSFGVVSKMYRALKPKERDAIAISLNSISKLKATPNDIQNALSILVLLRNRCAHDQRVYDFNPLPATIKTNNLIKQYRNNSPDAMNKSLFGAIGTMEYFLSPNTFKAILRDIKKLVKELFTNIHSVPTQSILDKMGMPQSFLS